MQIQRHKLQPIRTQKLRINDEFHFMSLDINNADVEMIALVDTNSRMIEVDINMYYDNSFVVVDPTQAYLGSVNYDGMSMHFFVDASGCLELDELF